MATLVIWDLDGTVTRSEPWIIASYQYAARASGLPIPDEKTLRKYMCGGLLGHLYELFGKDGEEALKLARDYRSYYVEHCLDRVEMFEGFPEVFGVLKNMGCRQAVATMKLETAAEELLVKLDVADYFVKIAGDNPDGTVTKEMMIRSCTETGDYDRVIMIGDCPSDMKAAKEAGVGFLAAAFGYGFPVRKCETEGIPYAEHARDIPGIVANFSDSERRFA